MKRRIPAISFLPVVCIIFVVMTGCSGLGSRRITGSGIPETTSFDFADFTGIDVDYTFDVTINQGAEYSVDITVDDNITQYLAVTNAGTTLSITLSNEVSYEQLNCSAEITMPMLDELTLNGVSSVYGHCDIGDLYVEVDGVSTVELSGSGGNLTAVVDGVSELDLKDFSVVDADVDIDGVSKVWLNMTGTLSGTLQGVSTLHYYGAPVLGDFTIEGSSDLVQGD